MYLQKYLKYKKKYLMEKQKKTGGSNEVIDELKSVIDNKNTYNDDITIESYNEILDELQKINNKVSGESDLEVLKILENAKNSAEHNKSLVNSITKIIKNFKINSPDLPPSLPPTPSQPPIPPIPSLHMTPSLPLTPEIKLIQDLGSYTIPEKEIAINKTQSQRFTERYNGFIEDIELNKDNDMYHYNDKGIDHKNDIYFNNLLNIYNVKGQGFISAHGKHINNELFVIPDNIILKTIIPYGLEGHTKVISPLLEKFRNRYRRTNDDTSGITLTSEINPVLSKKSRKQIKKSGESIIIEDIGNTIGHVYSNYYYPGSIIPNMELEFSMIHPNNSDYYQSDHFNYGLTGIITNNIKLPKDEYDNDELFNKQFSTYKTQSYFKNKVTNYIGDEYTSDDIKNLMLEDDYIKKKSIFFNNNKIIDDIWNKDYKLSEILTILSQKIKEDNTLPQVYILGACRIIDETIYHKKLCQDIKKLTVTSDLKEEILGISVYDEYTGDDISIESSHIVKLPRRPKSMQRQLSPADIPSLSNYKELYTHVMNQINNKKNLDAFFKKISKHNELNYKYQIILKYLLNILFLNKICFKIFDNNYFCVINLLSKLTFNRFIFLKEISKYSISKTDLWQNIKKTIVPTGIITTSYNKDIYKNKIEEYIKFSNQLIELIELIESNQFNIHFEDLLETINYINFFKDKILLFLEDLNEYKVPKEKLYKSLLQIYKQSKSKLDNFMCL